MARVLTFRTVVAAALLLTARAVGSGVPSEPVEVDGRSEKTLTLDLR